MSGSDHELAVDISLEHLEEFIDACKDAGIEVNGVQGKDVVAEKTRTLYENLDTITTIGGWVGGAWAAYHQAPVVLRGQLANFGLLDRRFDPKAGGHIIYYDAHHNLADARSSDLEYGTLRVSEPRQWLDINAVEIIRDTPTRLAFVKDVKRVMADHADLESVGAEIVEWDGVTRVDLEVNSRSRRRIVP